MWKICEYLSQVGAGSGSICLTRFEVLKDYLDKNANFSFIFVNNECMSNNIKNAYKVMKAPATIPNPTIKYVGNIDINKLKHDT